MTRSIVADIGSGPGGGDEHAVRNKPGFREQPIGTPALWLTDENAAPHRVSGGAYAAPTPGPDVDGPDGLAGAEVIIGGETGWVGDTHQDMGRVKRLRGILHHRSDGFIQEPDPVISWLVIGVRCDRDAGGQGAWLSVPSVRAGASGVDPALMHPRFQVRGPNGEQISHVFEELSTNAVGFQCRFEIVITDTAVTARVGEYGWRADTPTYEKTLIPAVLPAGRHTHLLSGTTDGYDVRTLGQIIVYEPVVAPAPSSWRVG